MTATFTRRPAPAFNEYGDPVEATTTTTDVEGCLFAPETSDEVRATGREGATIKATLYAPPGTDVSHLDEVTVDGQTYQVDQHPAAWAWIDQSGAGVAIPLRKNIG